MDNVKVSDITVKDIADYIRLTEISEEDNNFLTKCLVIAKAYIKSYTGVEDLDAYAEFVICVYVICQDLYDNRTLYLNTQTLNNSNYYNGVVDTILNLHNKNLI